MKQKRPAATTANHLTFEHKISETQREPLLISFTRKCLGQSAIARVEHGDNDVQRDEINDKHLENGQEVTGTNVRCEAKQQIHDVSCIHERDVGVDWRSACKHQVGVCKAVSGPESAKTQL